MPPIDIDPKTGAPIIGTPVGGAVNKNAKPDSDSNRPFFTESDAFKSEVARSNTGTGSDYSSKDNEQGTTEANAIKERHQAKLDLRDSSVDQQGRPDELPEGPRTVAPVSVGGSGPTNVVNETNPSFAAGAKTTDIRTPMELSKGIGDPNKPLPSADTGKKVSGRFDLTTGAKVRQLNPEKEDLPTTRTPPRMNTYSIGGEKAMTSQERREATPPPNTPYGQAVQIPAQVHSMILQTLKDNGMDSQQQGKALQRIGEILDENLRMDSLPEGQRKLNKDLQKPIKDIGTDNQSGSDR